MPPSISDPSAEPQISLNPRRWPADYYASATPDPVLPRWASYGCGAAALVVLLVVFVGGVWLSSGGLTTLIDFSLGMTLGEMRSMYTADVTPAQKETFEREIESMRNNARNGTIGAASLQPVLNSIQKAVKDEKLTPAEVDQITAAAKKTAPKPR